MKEKDIWSGGLLFLIGCGICFYASKTSIGTPSEPGPGFLALGAGGSLAILALGIVLRAWVSSKSSAERIEEHRTNLGRIFILCIVTVGYGYGLELLGYIIDTTLLMFILFRVAQPLPWIYVLLGSLSSSIFSYLLFHSWLKMELPMGIFGF